MARPSFLSDEHIPKAVAVGLRARGIDAATAAEAGQLGVPDAALMAFAQAQGRVLITADPDHLTTARRWRTSRWPSLRAARGRHSAAHRRRDVDCRGSHRRGDGESRRVPISDMRLADVGRQASAASHLGPALSRLHLRFSSTDKRQTNRTGLQWSGWSRALRSVRRTWRQLSPAAPSCLFSPGYEPGGRTFESCRAHHNLQLQNDLLG